MKLIAILYCLGNSKSKKYACSIQMHSSPKVSLLPLAEHWVCGEQTALERVLSTKSSAVVCPLYSKAASMPCAALYLLACRTQPSLMGYLSIHLLYTEGLPWARL